MEDAPTLVNEAAQVILCPRYTRRLLITLGCKKCPKICEISEVEAIFHLGHVFIHPVVNLVEVETRTNWIFVGFCHKL